MTEVINEDTEFRAAELFHELWVEWTKTLCREQFYDIPNHIRNHWAKNWVDYDQLPNHEQEKDRIIARRFLALLAK